MKDLRLIVCSQCFNVKAVLANTFGDTSYCRGCKKLTRHFQLKKAEFDVKEDLNVFLLELLKRSEGL